jgi:hypothetical protein
MIRIKGLSRSRKDACTRYSVGCRWAPDTPLWFPRSNSSSPPGDDTAMVQQASVTELFGFLRTSERVR